MSLAGKVALVTGAGKNIGRTIALDLAAQGASVVVNGRRDRAAVDGVVAEINAAGGQAVGCLADVSDAAAVQAMVDTAVAAFGGIDIVVSNAGLRRQTPFSGYVAGGVARDSVGRFGRGVHSVSCGGAAYGRAGRGRDRGAVGDLDPCGDAAALPCLGVEGRAGGADAGAGRSSWRRSGSPATRWRRGRSIRCAGRRLGVLPATLADIPLGRKAAMEEIAAAVRFLAGAGWAVHHRADAACEWRCVSDMRGLTWYT